MGGVLNGARGADYWTGSLRSAFHEPVIEQVLVSHQRILYHHLVIASAAKQSSRETARSATLESARPHTPTGLPLRVRLAMTDAGVPGDHELISGE